MVGLETAKWSDNSPADIGRLRSSCSTRRRVGSERALNTLFTSLYLANHRTIVKRQFRSISSQEWDDSDMDSIIASHFDWSRPRISRIVYTEAIHTRGYGKFGRIANGESAFRHLRMSRRHSAGNAG